MFKPKVYNYKDGKRVFDETGKSYRFYGLSESQGSNYAVVKFPLKKSDNFADRPFGSLYVRKDGRVDSSMYVKGFKSPAAVKAADTRSKKTFFKW